MWFQSLHWCIKSISLWICSSTDSTTHKDFQKYPPKFITIRFWDRFVGGNLQLTIQHFLAKSESKLCESCPEPRIGQKGLLRVFGFVFDWIVSIPKLSFNHQCNASLKVWAHFSGRLFSSKSPAVNFRNVKSLSTHIEKQMWPLKNGLLLEVELVCNK